MLAYIWIFFADFKDLEIFFRFLLTFARQKHIFYLCQTKREVILMSDKKMGRPTDNPKLNKISIRISDEDKDILDKYCEKENINKTEAISKGIKSLRPKE